MCTFFLVFLLFTWNKQMLAGKSMYKNPREGHIKYPKCSWQVASIITNSMVKTWNMTRQAVIVEGIVFPGNIFSYKYCCKILTSECTMKIKEMCYREVNFKCLFPLVRYKAIWHVSSRSEFLIIPKADSKTSRLEPPSLGWFMRFPWQAVLSLIGKLIQSKYA